MNKVKLLVAALLGSSAVLTGAAFFESGPDPVIFPRQQVPIYFNHDYHVRKPAPGSTDKGEGLACDFCHENVGDQTEAKGQDIPGHSSCDSCHGEWIGEAGRPAPRAECARCHKDLAGPTETATRAGSLVIPPPNIIFAHKTHVDAKIACTDCHARVPSKTVATRDDYPTMDRCIACHKERGVSTACKTCHLSGPSGRLITHLPSGELEPRRLHSFAIHSGEFLRNHAIPAQRQKDYCASCHSEADCLQCHDGVSRDVRYHPGDWISTHSIRSRKDDPRCQSCHRVQSFCLDCHVRSGVATVSALDATIVRRTVRRDAAGKVDGPHPMSDAGWLDPTSKNFHGFHAQRSIQACASCHQEQYCLSCHSSSFPGTPGTSQGANPHGPNPQRLRGSSAQKHNARMCLKCHSALDPGWR